MVRTISEIQSNLPTGAVMNDVLAAMTTDEIFHAIRTDPDWNRSCRVADVRTLNGRFIVQVETPAYTSTLCVSRVVDGEWVDEEVKREMPAGRTRWIVLNPDNWYTQWKCGGGQGFFSAADAERFSLQARETVQKPAGESAKAPSSVSVYYVCPKCGATSQGANFTTLPPYCDDCA